MEIEVKKVSNKHEAIIEMAKSIIKMEIDSFLLAVRMNKKLNQDSKEVKVITNVIEKKLSKELQEEVGEMLGMVLKD